MMEQETIVIPPALVDMFDAPFLLSLGSELGVQMTCHSVKSFAGVRTTTLVIDAQDFIALEVASNEVHRLIRDAPSHRQEPPTTATTTFADVQDSLMETPLDPDRRRPPLTAGPPGIPLRQEMEPIEEGEQPIHVFVDFSNIYLCAQVTPAPDGSRDVDLRLNISELADIVEKGREAITRKVFGSLPPANHRVWDSWREQSYQVSMFHSNLPAKGELAVDSALVAEIQRSLLQYSSRKHTLVMLTGDGNDNDGHASFLEAASFALQLGWDVEVWCWRHGCSRRYYALDDLYGSFGKFSLNFLDDYRARVVMDKSVPEVPRLIRVLSEESSGGDDGDEPHIEQYEMRDDQFICAITLKLLRDPVRSPHCEHYFEREVLTDIIQDFGICPIAALPLSVDALVEPDPEYLQQLARYWQDYLNRLPHHRRVEEERNLPPLVSEYQDPTQRVLPPADLPPRYKTSLCAHWKQTGTCHFGASCHFAHGDTELRQPLEINACTRRPPPRNYKTQLCSNWVQTGECFYGRDCHFAHGSHELAPRSTTPEVVPIQSSAEPSDPSRYRTSICRHWKETGVCPHGPACWFAHGEGQLRAAPQRANYKTVICVHWADTGSCPFGERCTFAHGECDLQI